MSYKNFFSGRSGKYNGTSNGDNDYWHRNILYCTFTQYIFRTKVYIIQIFLSALSCLSLLPLAALKHDTRHLIRHKTFYIHPHLACLFSNILYWSTSFSSLSLMFLFYHTFRTWLLYAPGDFIYLFFLVFRCSFQFRTLHPRCFRLSYSATSILHYYLPTFQS